MQEGMRYEYEVIKGEDLDHGDHHNKGGMSTILQPIKGLGGDQKNYSYYRHHHYDYDYDGGKGHHDQDDDIEMANLGVARGPHSAFHFHSTCCKVAAALPSPQYNNTHTGRLLSLDVFRGLTVVLMILVDHAGGIFPAINHSPWNGLTLADFVMPFFLFIVGVSLALANKTMSSRLVATRKATVRSLKLLILGIFLQGGYFHGIRKLEYGIDIKEIRWTGILQRIAISYLVAAVCEIWLRGDGKANSAWSLLRIYRTQWAVVLVLTSLYLSFLYGLYVPDWDYRTPSEVSSLLPKIFSVKCAVRGDTGPACNAAGMIDRTILGIQHLYRRPIYARTEQCSINSPDYGPLPPGAPSWCQAPFDPEGILSSLMAIVTCLIGLQYAHVIAHFKDHRSRLSQWILSSIALLVIGAALDFFGMHINKALYTVSYTCITAGAAGSLVAATYLMVDVYGYRRSSVVLEWIGKRALIIFILLACNILPVILQGFYWREPHNNALRLIGIKA